MANTGCVEKKQMLNAGKPSLPRRCDVRCLLPLILFIFPFVWRCVDGGPQGPNLPDCAATEGVCFFMCSIDGGGGTGDLAIIGGIRFDRPSRRARGNGGGVFIVRDSWQRRLCHIQKK